MERCEGVHLTLCFPGLSSNVFSLLCQQEQCSMWPWTRAKPYHCSQHGITLTVFGRSPLGIMIGEQIGYRWPGSLKRLVDTQLLH